MKHNVKNLTWQKINLKRKQKNVKKYHQSNEKLNMPKKLILKESNGLWSVKKYHQSNEKLALRKPLEHEEKLK